MIATLVSAVAMLAFGEPRVEVHAPGSDVRACAVSRSGKSVLAATAAGLATLGPDGQQTGWLTAIEGLPGSEVSALLQIDSTHWWVGTEGGLARVRVPVRGTPVVAQTIETKDVRALSWDGDALLVGTWGAGVLRYDGDAVAPLVFEAEAASAAQLRITDFATFDGETLAATAGAGLWTVGRDQLVARPSVLDDTIVWSIDADGSQLWVGTLEGLYRGKSRLQRVSGVDARGVRLSGDTVQVATVGDGLVSWSGSTPGKSRTEYAGAVVRATDMNKGKRCIATDDGLWIDAGPGTAATAHLRSAIPSRDISATAHDPSTGRLWIGTFDKGLAYHDDTGWHRVEARGVDPQINALAVDDAGSVWVATARGLAKLSGDEVTVLGRKAGMPHEHVLSVMVRANGDVVAGTARGFVIVHEGKVVRADRARPRERWAVWSVAEDTAGTLWLGTTVGLIAWPEQEPWRRYSMLDGALPDNWVTSVVTDGDALWVGTYAAGVVHLRPGVDDSVVSTVLGGGRINPSGLTIVGEHVYASTMGGLLRRPRGGSGAWTALDRLGPGRDTTGVVSVDGALWVATRRGLGAS